MEKTASISYSSENNPEGSAQLAIPTSMTNQVSQKIILSSNKPYQVAFFIDKTCKAVDAQWESYSEEKTITLPDSDGPHTISILFRDEAHFVGECTTIPLLLDREGPRIGQSSLKKTHSLLNQSPEFSAEDIVDTYSNLKRLEARLIDLETQLALTAWMDFGTNTLSQKIVGLSLVDGKLYALEIRALDELENIGPVIRLPTFQAGPQMILSNQDFNQGGPQDYLIQLSQPSFDSFEIEYTTEDDTAVSGIDYLSNQGTLVINAGGSSSLLSITTMETLYSGARKSFKFKATPISVQTETPSLVTFNVPLTPNFTSFPHPNLLNLPGAMSSTSPLNIQVSGSTTTQYQYKLFEGSNGDCATTDNWSSKQSTSVAITSVLSSYSKESNLTLCIVGHSAHQVTSFYKQSWIFAVPDLGGFSSPTAIYDENTSNVQVQIGGWDVQTFPFEVYYDVRGSATSADHDLTNGSVTIPAGATYANITFNILRNPATTGEKEIIIRATGTNHPSFFTLSYQETRVKIRDTESPNTRLQFTQVSAGEEHTCALATNKKIYCWGLNTNGQLGDGTTISRLVPRAIQSSENFVSVESGERHVCAITDLTSQLYCWGENVSGQLGNGSNLDLTIPTLISVKNGGIGLSMVSAGGRHTCAITTGMDLYCWGENNGQIGDGTLLNRPTPVFIDSMFASISLGLDFSCGIKLSHISDNEGDVYCWGGNYTGQLGKNTGGVAMATPQYIDLTGTGSKAWTVSAHKWHTCAIDASSNKLYCWGYNGSGQLGDTTSTTRTQPTPVSSTDTFSRVIGGENYTCGIRSTDNSLRCWGYSNNGIFGNGNSGFYPQPTWTPLTFNNDISGGNLHACGIINNELVCWGSNIHGQLGRGTTTILKTPTLVDSTSIYTSVSMSDDLHVCALTDSKKVHCWGLGNYGQLGLGSSALVKSKPEPILEDGNSYNSITAGRYHTCGLTDQGLLKCWGINTFGQLGLGTTGWEWSSVPADTETVYTSISLGWFSCGITSLNKIKCWGENENQGGIGDGTTLDRLTPTFIDSSTSYNEISVGLYHACGITSTSKMKCWGWNGNSQIGNGNTTNRSTPTSVDGASSYLKVSAGKWHTCGINSNNKLRCWGSNHSYQSAASSGANTNINPTTISTTPACLKFKEVSSGAYSSCAITLANAACAAMPLGDKLYCWGTNTNGQLGLPASTQATTPTAVDSATNYKSISVGERTTCGVTTAGALKCWGENSAGQLGIGDISPWIPDFVSPPSN